LKEREDSYISGSKIGGARAKAKLLAKDPDYYKKLGKKGGQATSGYAFGHGKVNPSEAGRKGGATPRRKKVAK
jgi:uncharacterized protein